MLDPESVAREVGLRYVDDSQPGITRRRRGRGFSYSLPDGSLLREGPHRERIAALAVPPAWRSVWICRWDDGHLQATGRDDEDRKQYLYHERWGVVRDRIKFERLVEFGHALPRIRSAVGRDLRLEGMPRRKALAAAVRLMDQAGIRVGNRRYAARNGTFGATTLRRRHLDVDGDVLEIRFRSKGGADVNLTIEDGVLASVLEQARDLPGWEIFTWEDDDGTRSTLDAADVNEYLREVGGGPFTAKDFRTWAGTTRALAGALRQGELPEEERKTRWLEVVDEVAAALHNTRAVARESYIHPRLEPAVLAGELGGRLEAVKDRAEQLRQPGRRTEERQLLALLEELNAELAP